MQGTVKSYNAKGFGFILSDSMEHDIYFSRESLQQGLRTANIAGTMVSFELARGPGGKPLARNLRPVHGVPPNFYNARSSSSYVPPPRFPMGPPQGLPPPHMGMGMGMGGPAGPPCMGGGHFVPCPAGMAPPPMAQPRPPRSLSPHAGSRAMMGLKREEEEKKVSRSASSSSDDGSESSASSDQKKKKKKDKGKKRARSGSSGSDGSEKKKKKKKKRKRSSSSSSSSSDCKAEVIGDEKGGEKDGEEKVENKEIEEAKREALKKLQSLQGIANKEQRMKDWRALLRTWHPDKNPENVEVATAVFQFLQKGKVLLDGN